MPRLILTEMFADLTREQETEILIAALTHEGSQTAAVVAAAAAAAALSSYLPPSSSQVL